MNTHYDIPLHDIKPLMEVQEYSLFYLITFVVLLFILIVLMFYFLYKLLKEKSITKLRKSYIQKLFELDIDKTKNTAYEITKLGELFKNDSSEHLSLYIDLVKNLDEYKYKKNVEFFDEITEEKIQRYKDILNAK